MTEPEAVGAEAFRAAVGRVGSPLVVVTTVAEGRPVGLAVRAFAVASMEPPLVVVCIPRAAAGFREFQGAQAFGVSVMTQGPTREAPAEGEALAWPGEQMGISGAVTGVPLVPGAEVGFECVLYDRHAAGDGIVMVGEVVGITGLR